MKPLEAAKIAELSRPLPMSRHEKLTRWAILIEKAHHTIRIFHRLEYMAPYQRDQMCEHDSAFDVAYRDEVLRTAGLAGPTYGDAKKFFELSDEDIHAFSCNCGGQVSNKDMAGRIRKMAGPVERSPFQTAMMVAMLPLAAAAITLTLVHLA